MTRPPSISAERRLLLWQRVYPVLAQHAVPDSRFHYDFLSFTPDFRGSSSATDRLVGLPCYKSANTLLVTPDNSLEDLRHRALKDGKKLLVATFRLRRGFVLLDPSRMSDEQFELASSLDGMEKRSIGKAVTLSQIQDENIRIDLCVVGGLVFNTQGVIIWEGHGLFEVQWALLQDIKVLSSKVPVIAVGHDCQVVDEAEQGIEKIIPDKTGEVQCDFVVTPERVIEVDDAVKPTSGVNFETVDPEALQNIQPLQELKGIRMMEEIMKDSGFTSEKEAPKPPTADEQKGIDIVERLMRGYKA